MISLDQRPMIACDIDNTLARLIPEAVNHLRRNEGLPPVPQPGDWGFQDWPQEDYRYTMDAIARPELYRLATPYFRSVEWIKALAVGHRIVYLTARGRELCPANTIKEIADLTLDWLQSYGYPPGDVHLVTDGRNKVTWCNNDLIGQPAFAIEDSYHEAYTYAQVGILCFLLRRKYNERQLGQKCLSLMVPIKDLGEIQRHLDSEWYQQYLQKRGITQ